MEVSSFIIIICICKLTRKLRFCGCAHYLYAMLIETNCYNNNDKYCYLFTYVWCYITLYTLNEMQLIQACFYAKSSYRVRALT